MKNPNPTPLFLALHVTDALNALSQIATLSKRNIDGVVLLVGSMFPHDELIMVLPIIMDNYPDLKLYIQFRNPEVTSEDALKFASDQQNISGVLLDAKTLIEEREDKVVISGNAGSFLVKKGLSPEVFVQFEVKDSPAMFHVAAKHAEHLVFAIDETIPSGDFAQEIIARRQSTTDEFPLIPHHASVMISGKLTPTFIYRMKPFVNGFIYDCSNGHPDPVLIESLLESIESDETEEEKRITGIVAPLLVEPS